MQFLLSDYESSLAPILLVTDNQSVLRALEFADHEPRMRRMLREHYGECELAEGTPPKSIVRALDAYFEGDFGLIDEIRIATGGTAFQRKVWQELRKISPGATKSYGELAAVVGNAKASRAVGAANGANPIAIVVPCHRVIGADGSLTGYGGGLSRKRWLLDHEQANIGADAHGRLAIA